MSLSLRLLIENGPVVQPSFLRKDSQCPLSCLTYPFCRDDNEGEDEALQATLLVKAGEDAADLGQKVNVEVLQHGSKEQEHRIVFHG